MNRDSTALAEALAKVALGDRAALRRVYEMTSAHLFSIALRILNRRDVAEDVLQESFISVWQNAVSYNASASQPMTWLISIVRNKAIDVLRSAPARYENTHSANGEMPESADGRGSSLDLLMSAADAMAIRACLEALEATQRQSLALAYYHGLSHSEIAGQIEAPLGTVKAWVRRGLERLKRCLENES